VLCFVSRKLSAITEWDFLAVLDLRTHARVSGMKLKLTNQMLVFLSKSVHYFNYQ
jgi:hypothetical protein